MSNEFEIADNSATAIFVKGGLTFHQPKYLCPKHGLVTGTVRLYGDGGETQGDYCMECYKDWIRANLQPLQPHAAGGEE